MIVPIQLRTLRAVMIRLDIRLAISFSPDLLFFSLGQKNIIFFGDFPFYRP